MKQVDPHELAKKAALGFSGMDPVGTLLTVVP